MRPRLLVVDDNLLNIELVSFVLGTGGFEVEAAQDAAQAMARLAAVRPDLILMDVLMPGTDGLELTRRLKADPATRGIPVIAFTALALKEDAARIAAAGCDGYLTKPVDVTTFAGRVHDYLADHRAAGRPPAG
jgi:CheY-like chemotaxis protein